MATSSGRSTRPGRGSRTHGTASMVVLHDAAHRGQQFRSWPADQGDHRCWTSTNG